MASFAFKPLQEAQLRFSSFIHCKCYSTVNPFNFHHSFSLSSSSSSRHACSPKLSLFLRVRAQIATPLEAKLPGDKHRNVSTNTVKYKAREQNSSGSSSSSSSTHRRRGQSSVVEDNGERRVVLKDRHARTRTNSENRREMGSQFSSMRSKDGGRGRSSGKKSQDSQKAGGEKCSDMGDVNHLERGGRRSRKIKDESPENTLRVGLDMCSKTGDVTAAIKLYDLARKEELKLGQYHYAVLLYLCSSAAGGVLQPAKSGSRNRKLTPPGFSKDASFDDSDSLIEQPKNENFDTSMFDSNFLAERSDKEDLKFNGFPEEVKNDSKTVNNGLAEPYPETLDEIVLLLKSNADRKSISGVEGEQGDSGIEVSEDIKNYALKRGFEIYENMLLEKVPMNEATFTSVARMAMSQGDGDMAFEIVKQMKELGITPRLRSYGPALSVFCDSGDVEKAFLVEQHMLEQSISPEEPELEALLRVSVEAGRSDKVYYLLHKLRTNVRQVTPSTADVIEKWFRSNVASKVGKKKWSQKMITEAITNGGGGWHGQGWLGMGKWSVSRTSVGSDGFCRCCGEKLATIDLDPAETENFAKSVASLALQREKTSHFEKFQKWLDYYGPFEAIVDAANIGLYSQRSFKPSKVNAVVNGIRQMLPSKRWPLIILHNRRINGDQKMNEPVNKAIIERWRNADALYATPTGSNDDWYWLYAAIKFKCLIVTNDEMRDHLFQLLGKDFFPKWKERHQVRFSFAETGPVFHMPPPCSVVIQESEKGHWHVPIESEDSEFQSYGERTWLCITRAASRATGLTSSIIHNDVHDLGNRKKRTSSSNGRILTTCLHGNHDHGKQAPPETYKKLKNILSSSLISDSDSILPDLEDAENFGGWTIDFQI
ncbi:OLC1v1037331C1 [Oldenlandia corymbosa var. corymbosa]|uniref:ribonuclease P n=1 Tax=Oldenlandia corymbosa var. corymbosa TaxID=529605 RepID=A0AAV1CYB6_OLDCO|nr:OLC1v1037331C1 [Oldenlandia corymbosa var. corymbosa]